MAAHVRANFALTLDGSLGGPGRTRLRISNREDKARVHRLRSTVDAIVVGVGTVIADDPKLTVKWRLAGKRPRRNPLRVVLDPRLRTPRRARVASAASPTLFFAGPHAKARPDWTIERVNLGRGGLDLDDVLRRVEAYGGKRILVEGGPKTLTRFFAKDHVDEATVFVSPKRVSDESAPRLVEGLLEMRRHLKLAKAEPMGDGVLLRYQR